MARNRITPVGRLIIFILVFAPIAYFGASYITGQSFKEPFQQTSTPKAADNTSKELNVNELLEEKDAIIEQYQKMDREKQREIELLKAEIERLKK